MTETLRFDELIPDRDQFELSDGQKIDFMAMADLDAIDAARALQIQKRIKGIDTDELTEENAAALNEALADLILLILPEMPSDILAGLKTGQRLMIVNFWSENSGGGLSKNGRGQADPA